MAGRGGAPHGGRTLNGGAAAEWWASLFLLALVSLATTMPLGFLWARPAWAAAIMSAASIVSLAGFQTLTVAGLIAQLTGAYRLGRRGSPWIKRLVLSLPFLILALTASPGSAARIPALWPASLGPAAALAGSDAGPSRGDRAQRGPGGYCGHPARAHRAGGTRPDLPRAA